MGSEGTVIRKRRGLLSEVHVLPTTESLAVAERSCSSLEGVADPEGGKRMDVTRT